VSLGSVLKRFEKAVRAPAKKVIGSFLSSATGGFVPANVLDDDYAQPPLVRAPAARSVSTYVQRQTGPSQSFTDSYNQTVGLPALPRLPPPARTLPVPRRPDYPAPPAPPTPPRPGSGWDNLPGRKPPMSLKRRPEMIPWQGSQPGRRRRRAKGITGTELKSFRRVTGLLQKLCKTPAPTRRARSARKTSCR
jgi:hypothetical protein